MKLNSKIVMIVLLIIISTQVVFADEISSKRKGNPLLKSAIIPGWGELSMGAKSGYFFLALEASIWGSLFYVRDQEDLSERKAFSFAVENANIDPQLDYSEEQLGYMKKYNNSGYEPGGYNFLVMQQALNLYPDDPEMQEAYVNDHAIPDEYAWDWDSAEDRRYYAGRRTDILDYADAGKVITGVILVNHILSVVNTARVKKQEPKFTSNLKIDKDLNPGFEFSYKF